MGIKIDIKGAKELQKKLQKIQKMDIAKQILKVNTGELNNLMQRNAYFKGDYTVGDTRRSILSTFENDGKRSITKPGTPYSPYVEWGTRFMDAQPFVKPSWNVQKEIFKQDLEKLVK